MDVCALSPEIVRRRNPERYEDFLRSHGQPNSLTVFYSGGDGDDDFLALLRLASNE
jgi:hypothetical protein